MVSLHLLVFAISLTFLRYLEKLWWHSFGVSTCFPGRAASRVGQPEVPDLISRRVKDTLHARMGYET